MNDCLINTGVICMVFVDDPNREDGRRCVDLGNYFKTPDGENVLVIDKEIAQKYGHLVKEKIYVPLKKTT
jgi:hypothetical protein